MWINFAFVATGVATGLALGALVPNKSFYPMVLRVLFVRCAMLIEGGHPVSTSLLEHPGIAWLVVQL